MIRRLYAAALDNLRAVPSSRECVRMIAGWAPLRAISATFVTSVVGAAVGATGWPHEEPVFWASVWLPAYVGLCLLAGAAGVSGLRGHHHDNR